MKLRAETTKEEIEGLQKNYAEYLKRCRPSILRRVPERDWIQARMLCQVPWNGPSVAISEALSQEYTPSALEIQEERKRQAAREKLQAQREFEAKLQEEKRQARAKELAAKLQALPSEVKAVVDSLTLVQEERCELADKWEALPVEFKKLVVVFVEKVPTMLREDRDRNIYSNHLGWIRNQIKYNSPEFLSSVDTNSVAYKSLTSFVKRVMTQTPNTHLTQSSYPATRFDHNKEAQQLNEDLKQFSQHYRA